MDSKISLAYEGGNDRVSSEEEYSKIKAEMLFVIGKYESLITLVSKSPYASEERTLMIMFYGIH